MRPELEAPTIQHRIRRTLEVLRDEIRLSAPRYSQLRHERFISPLPVKRDGWLAFARSQSESSGWEEWQFARRGCEMGRFFGSKEGLAELDCFLSEFADITGCSLLEVVHDFAILEASPLLSVTPDVWNWDPSENIHDDGYVLDVDPFLEVWDEASSGDERYPKHWLMKRLGQGIYGACALAIDWILTPQDFFILRKYREDDVPLTIDQIAERWSDPVSDGNRRTDHTQSETDSPLLAQTGSECVFRQSGEIWHIRYSSRGKVEETTLKLSKGLARYAQLLRSPNRPIPSIHFDLPGMPNDFAMITADEAFNGLKDDSQNQGFMIEGTERNWKLTPYEVAELRSGNEELSELMAKETNPERKRDLKQAFFRTQRKLYTGHDTSELQSEAELAHRRVKKSLYDARVKLEKATPLLHRHLEAFVMAEGYNFVYRPDNEIHWEA